MLTWIKRGGWLVGLGLAGIIGAAWLWLAANSTMARLAAEGVTAEARIDEMREVTAETGGLTRRSSTGTVTDYFATVTFATPDGTSQTVTQIVSKPWYDTWFPNQMTTIRYLPDDPGVVQIDAGFAQTTDQTGAYFVAGFSVLPILLGLYMVWLFNGKARLREGGVAVVASTVKVARNGKFNVLHYSFALPDGRKVKGKSLPRMQDMSAFVPGAGVDVRYDPQRPGNNKPAFDLAR